MSDKQGKKIFYFEQIEPMFGRGKRDWSVDVLRCLSCFLVCAIHSTRATVGMAQHSGGENIWLHNEVYAMAFAAPTVLFVMVSGIFFLSPERNVRAGKVWKKNVLKMSFAYIFWSIIYAAFRIWTMDPQPEITGKYFFEQCLVEHYHLWYIPMILGLYIISPVLRPITATYNRKLFAYIVVIFMGAMVLWTIRNLSVIPDGSYSKLIIDKTPMELICQYPFWMLFGWIAYTYRPSRAIRLIIYALGIAALVVGIMANMHAWFAVEDTEFVAMTQKFGFVTFFKNVAIFYFIVSTFRKHEFSEITKKILGKWSECTLIIYLIHALILGILRYHDFLYDMGMSPWVGVWIYAIIAYLGGGLVAVVFHVFWDPIKKDLTSKKTRSEKIYEKMDRKSSREVESKD